MEPGARPWGRNQAAEFIHLEDLKGPTANTVVDNSEVVHKVGIAIELCGNNSQFKSDMSLILLWLTLSHKSCGSYLYGDSALRLLHTHQHLSIVLLGLTSIEWLKTWVSWSQLEGPGPCSDHWECLSCTYRPLLFCFRRVEPSVCPVLQFQCLLI